MGGDADTGSDGITPVASPAPAAIAIANDSDDDDVMPGETLRSSPKRLASPMKNASPKSRTKVRCAQSCAGTRPARLAQKIIAHHHNARPTSMHQAAVIPHASPLKNIASSTPMQSTPVKHLSFTPEVRAITALFSKTRFLSSVLPPSTPHATLTSVLPAHLLRHRRWLHPARSLGRARVSANVATLPICTVSSLHHSPRLYYTRPLRTR